MRPFLIALLTGGLLLGTAGPARAQGGGGTDPCAALTHPDGLPCVPVPIIQEMAEKFSEPDPCQLYGAQAALPALTQAYTVNPGVSPSPPPPLTQPFGAGPIGPATAYSPPGLTPVYGPLGPGTTAAAIARAATPPPTLSASGTPLQNYQNAQTLLGLAGLQQAEMSTLIGRSATAGTTQLAAGGWVSAWSQLANATLTIMRGYCRGQREAASQSTPDPNR